MTTSATYKPPHAGHPTPICAEAPARRRVTSFRLFGRPDMIVDLVAWEDMFWAGYGYRQPASLYTDIEAALR